MRGMLRILRRLEMISRVGPIAWNSYSRSEDQQTHDTGANLVADSGTHPGHYAPPRRIPMAGPRWSDCLLERYRKRSAICGLQKSHTARNFFGESVAMLRLGIAAMRRPHRG